MLQMWKSHSAKCIRKILVLFLVFVPDNTWSQSDVGPPCSVNGSIVARFHLDHNLNVTAGSYALVFNGAGWR